MNAVCSILKFIGPIKIDISKQKTSDQLFEIKTEERKFSSAVSYKHQQTSVVLLYYRRDLR